MAKKSKTKQINLKIEIVAKSPYAGSGPRGVDVYATHLYNALASTYSRNKSFLSRDQAGSQVVDLVHYTFFDPFFLTLWNNHHQAKYIVTVHDLIPLKFPAHFPVGIRGKFNWFLQKRALHGASAIITDSLCSKRDITALTAIAPHKIHVIPLAAGHTTVNEKMVKIVKSTYQLPDRYLLYVGDINWNKNIPGLIRAFGALNSGHIHLVLVGKAFESSRDTREYRSIDQAIQATGKADYIHMLGFIPSHHLPAVYRGATLYIQPSWYEGFGLPVLEAMEQGTPVACSSLGSLREVGGEFVHYFDPHDLESMTATINDLLHNPAKRAKYIQEGKVWARTFSWEKVVVDTHTIYEKIVH